MFKFATKQRNFVIKPLKGNSHQSVTFRFQNFSVSKLFHFLWYSQIGIEKFWYRKKYWYRYRKKYWFRSRKVYVSVSIQKISTSVLTVLTALCISALRVLNLWVFSQVQDYDNVFFSASLLFCVFVCLKPSNFKAWSSIQ